MIMSLAIKLSSQDNLAYYIQERINSYGPIFGEEEVNSSRIVYLMFVKPLITDEDYKIKPILFQEPLPEGILQENGSVRYTFDILPDIYWDDGIELTAEDIEYTYRVIKNQNVTCTNAREKVANISEIYAVSIKKLEVIFKQRNEDNLGSLTFSVLPKHKFNVAERDNPTWLKPSEKFFLENPVGCGMYKNNTIHEGMLTILEKNNNFFLKNQIPRFDHIKVQKKEMMNSIIEAFLGEREINFLPDVPISRKDDIVADPMHDIISYHEFSWQFVAFNMRLSVFQDINLRKAINLAVDKEDMNMNIFQNEAGLITGPFPPTSPAYNSGYEEELYDLEKAAELLNNHDYSKNGNNGYLEKNGTKLEFCLTYKKGIDDDQNTATSLFNSLKDLGIDLILDPLESDSFNKKVYEDRNFDMALVEFSFGTDPDIFTIFHSLEDRYKGNNVCGFSFPEIDKLLEETRNKPDRNIRMKLYKKLHQEIVELYPGIFLWQKPNFIAFEKNIEGINEDTIDPINIFKNIYKW